MSRIRLSLDIDIAAKERIDTLQARLGSASKTAIIQRALTVLDLLTEDPSAKIQVTKNSQTETLRFL